MRLRIFTGKPDDWLTWKGLFKAYVDQKRPEVVGVVLGTIDLGDDKSTEIKCEKEQLAVGGKGVLTRAVAAAEDKARVKLAKTNRLLHSVLVSHTEGAPSSLVEECAEACDGVGAWLALTSKCEVKSSVSVGTAVRNLTDDVPAFSRDPDVYFGRVERLQRQLRATDVEISDKVLMVVGLSRLPVQYDGLTTVLDAASELTYDQFKEQVRVFYRRKVSKTSGVPKTPAVPVPPADEALKAAVVVCGYCGKNGHSEKKCFKKAKRANVQCRKCGEMGHYENECKSDGSSKENASTAIDEIPFHSEGCT